MSQPKRFDLAQRMPLPRAAFLAFLAACSSGTPTSPGGTTTAAASIAISAGDGQTSQPGAAVTVNPAVIVKSSSGQPVSGVAVTFAVDSGGGSLAATSAVTGSNGIATSGVWTLGPAEGRNTLKATAGSLAPITIAATAMIAGGSVPTATVPTGGGSITVTTPGPLKGFELDVPSGAFSTALQLTVSYASSVALPHAAGVTLGSPIVSLSSNAVAAANSPYTIRIPATISGSQIPIVAMVDPITGYVDALPILSYDSTGVTALGTAIDESQSLDGSSRRIGLAGAAARSAASVEYAVMLRDSSLLHTVSIDTHFAPGVDDWEFHPQPTQVSGAPEPGEVVSERYYFLNQKSQTSGSLSGRFEQTPGVEASDAAGIRWSAALAQEFAGLVSPYILKASAARTANKVLYDRNTIQTIVANMIASDGRPQIVAFVDPSTNIYNVVLAYRWDGPSGTLYTANPDFPGDASRDAIWDSNGLGCTTFCLAIAGLNHLIGYQTQLDGEFPSVLDGTIDKSLFPQAFAESYDPFVGETPEIGIDTLFLAHDTTRVWIECPTCAGSFPTMLPLQHGGSGIETQQIYLPGLSGSWSASGGQTETGFAIDVTQFPSPSGNHFANFQFGIEALGLLRQVPGQVVGTGWLGWSQYRVIKFDPQLTNKQAITGLPATITLTAPDGPPLPNGLSYLFKWGDGSEDTDVSPLPTNVMHIFPSAGIYNVVMEMHHTSDDQVVGSASLAVTVVNGPTWQLNGASLTSSALPTLVNAHDTAEQTAVNTFLSNVQATPSSTLIFALINPTCPAAVLEHFPARLAVVDTGLVSGTTTVIAGIAASCDAGGSFAMGTLGNGALTGAGPSGAVVNGFGNFIAGGSAAIDADMAGTALSGTITLNVLYTGGTAAYTIEFTAALVSPLTISTAVRRH